MTRAPRRRNPLLALRPHLEGLSALEAAAAIAHPTPAVEAAVETLGIDRARLVVDVYESMTLGVASRRQEGVFYTPEQLVESMLDRVPLEGELLDPACGAGAFILAIARRLGPEVLTRLSACDIDGSALDVCALALETAFPRHRDQVRAWRRTRAFASDFIRDPWPGKTPDLIVGNPPYRVTKTSDLPALFPHLRGEIDLYACFLSRAVERVSKAGTVALLVPDTWLTNRNSESLRRLLLDAGLSGIVDFGKPFLTARDTRVHAVVVCSGSKTCTVESLRDGVLRPMQPASHRALGEGVGRGWFLYRTSAEARACRALETRGEAISKRFDVIYGLRTGDNARHIGSGPGAVPLVAGADIQAFDRRSSTRHLVDPLKFERGVAAQSGRAKLGVQRIRTNSRVSWRRWIEAAPLSANEVGLDSLTLMAPKTRSAELDDETCALLGVLSSSVLNRWYRLSFTDVNVKPAYLRDVPIPPPSPHLSALVRTRLKRPEDLYLERCIDRLVVEAWELDERDIQALEMGFWGSELGRRPLPSLREALDFNS